MFPSEIIEKASGYVFKDKSLLEQAFTHKSYIAEHGGESYERLEFLGDSILNFIVAENLFFSGETASEGDMTVLRSDKVSKGPLSDAVDKMGIYRFVKAGNGAASDIVSSSKNKSDIFESLLAAIYLDSGKNLDAARAFVNVHLKGVFYEPDYKSAFQEYAQANGKKIEYSQAVKSGENHKPSFFVKVYLDGMETGAGSAGKIKYAQRAAAKDAMEKLGITGLTK